MIPSKSFFTGYAKYSICSSIFGFISGVLFLKPVGKFLNDEDIIKLTPKEQLLIDGVVGMFTGPMIPAVLYLRKVQINNSKRIKYNYSQNDNDLNNSYKEI